MTLLVRNCTCFLFPAAGRKACIHPASVFFWCVCARAYPQAGVRDGWQPVGPSHKQRYLAFAPGKEALQQQGQSALSTSSSPCGSSCGALLAKVRSAWSAHMALSPLKLHPLSLPGIPARCKQRVWPAWQHLRWAPACVVLRACGELYAVLQRAPCPLVVQRHGSQVAPPACCSAG